MSPVKSPEGKAKSIAAGNIVLKVLKPSIFRPVEVLRGPWAEVGSPKPTLCEPKGRFPRSTVTPLQPTLIVQVVSKNVDTREYVIQVTLLLVNGFSDVEILRNRVRNLVSQLIDLDQNKKFETDFKPSSDNSISSDSSSTITTDTSSINRDIPPTPNWMKRPE
jgi:hypothetical protein